MELNTEHALLFDRRREHSAIFASRDRLFDDWDAVGVSKVDERFLWNVAQELGAARER
jgi:hypothetical protein